MAEAWGNYYPIVDIDGPAFGTVPGEFTPGLYVKQGVTFTSRGCNNHCPWCLVPKREGRLRELALSNGHIINDNNFLQCSRDHRLAVYWMLDQQKERATFSGGLQPNLVTDEIAAEFRDIRIEDVFLAADTEAALAPLERAIARLQFLGRERTRCYTLIAFGDETIKQAERRLKAVWELGAMPHAQLYQPADRYVRYSQEWRALARTWSRPAAMKAEMRGVDHDRR